MALRQKANRNPNLIQTAGPRQPLEYPCLQDAGLHWKKFNPKPSFFEDHRFSQSSNTLARNMQVNT